MTKTPFFLMFSFCSFAASAQQNNFLNIPQYLQKKATDKAVSKPLAFFKPFFQNFAESHPQEMIIGKFSHTLPNGDKVYTLSQDNMPCITTDLYKFDISNGFKENKVSSPFIFYYNKPGSIPNAVNP